jgi:hypothetical protein
LVKGTSWVLFGIFHSLIYFYFRLFS